MNIANNVGDLIGNTPPDQIKIVKNIGGKMKLIVNGKEETINREEITVVELLKEMNVKMPDMVSVQLNRDILLRKNYDSIYMNENDEVNFLYFMGGGEFIR